MEITPVGKPLLAVLDQLTSDETVWSTLTSSMSSQRHWAAIDSILRRAWWGRAWVIQEATGPIRTYALCGTASIDFPDMVKSLLVGRLITQMPGYPFGALSTRCAYCMHKVSELRRYKQLRLLDALQFGRSFSCADPRDKVYSVLGLVHDPEVITPDYKRSIREVYTDVVQYCIKAYTRFHRLDFLAYVDGTSETSSEAAWPSFVPDWRTFSGFDNFKKTSKEYEITDRLYRASLDHEGCISLVGGALLVDAFTVDRVVQTRKACEDEKDIKDTMMSWRPANAADLYVDGNTIENAYLHTIVGDVSRGRDFSLTRGHSFEPTALQRTYGQSSSVAGFQETHLTRVAMERTVLNRRMFRTDQGFLGIGPANMAVNDHICGLLGGQMLYVVRNLDAVKIAIPESKLEATFVGECYVHGLMDGGALQYNDDGSVTTRRMVIR